MTLAHATPTTTLPRDELFAFYDAYFEALDELRLEDWTEFFVDDCVYRIISRENYDAGLGLCIMQGDSKGMLVDRVRAIRHTQVFAPRFYRRFYSGLRISGEVGGEFHVRQNIMMVQTLVEKASEIHGCGIGRDRLVREPSGGLKFVERTIVLDTWLINNSVIYPF